MELQNLIDQWESAEDMSTVEQRNAPQVEETEWSGWTVEWVFRALLVPHRVRASYQEEEALKNFARIQRGGELM